MKGINTYVKTFQINFLSCQYISIDIFLTVLLIVDTKQVKIKAVFSE